MFFTSFCFLLIFKFIICGLTSIRKLALSMLYIASDHADYQLKEEIRDYLDELGIKYRDLGPKSFDPDDDYPETAKAHIFGGRKHDIVIRDWERKKSRTK